METFNVLVLEDDADFLEAVTEELEDAGYAVTGVGHGPEAVARVAETSFDVVIVDVRMKGIDGLEALARMRHYQQDLACIVMTGYAEEEDAIRAVRLGVRGYLRKPFELKELLEKVASVLAEQQRLREQAELWDEVAETLRWSARAISKLSGREHLARAVELAGALGENVGFSPLMAAKTELLTSSHGAGLSPPPTLLDQHRAVNERWDGSGPRGLAGDSIPVESRIATLALSETHEQSLPPGQLDPFLQETLTRLSTPGGREAWRARRKLLSLGLALLQTGNLSGAREALSELVRRQPEGPEAASAYLGLARISNLEEREQHLENAIACAARVGPVAQARTQLEVALIISETDNARARPLLQEARDRLEGYPEATLARLALWAPDQGEFPQQELSTILAPSNEYILSAWTQWLLPVVAEGLARGAVEAFPASRFFSGHPTALVDALEKNLLTLPQRLAVASTVSAKTWSAKVLKLLREDPAPEVRARLQEGLGPARGEQLPLLRMHSFGAFQVFVGEKHIEGKRWKGNKPRYLLALLASRETPINEEVLIDTFWPNSYDKGKRGLYNAISLYRRVLKSEGHKESTDYVVRNGDRLSLNPERERWHDLEEVKSLLARADQTGEPLEAVRFCRQVVALYRGPYLEGCYMDWAVRLRDSLELEILSALMKVAGAAFEAGLKAEALELSQQVCEYDNCNQPAHELVMESCLALGKPEHALRTFQKLESSLKRELGIEPSTAILRAYHKARLL